MFSHRAGAAVAPMVGAKRMPVCPCLWNNVFRYFREFARFSLICYICGCLKVLELAFKYSGAVNIRVQKAGRAYVLVSFSDACLAANVVMACA